MEEDKEHWRSVFEPANVQRVVARLAQTQGEEQWPEEADRKCAAVLVPLVTVGGEPSVLFTLRSRELSHHRNQVSFPGGVVDDGDGTSTATALRETEEELGISPQSVEVWGRLHPLPGRGRSSIITPVVGRVRELDFTTLRVNPAEVEEVFTLPLHHLANPRHQGYTEFRIRGRSLTSYHSPAFRGGPHRIWGFTGFILDMVLLRLAPTAVKYSPIVSRTLTTTIARTFKH